MSVFVIRFGCANFALTANCVLPALFFHTIETVRTDRSLHEAVRTRWFPTSGAVPSRLTIGMSIAVLNFHRPHPTSDRRI